jgi:hypothetical protein
MRTFASLLCLSWLVMLAGCGTPPEQRLDAPAMRVAGLTAAGDGYALVLRVVNTNTVPLVVTKSTHTLYLGDQRIARVDDPSPIGVPPLGSVDHTVTVAGKSAAEVRAWLAGHPGDAQVAIESALTLAIGTEDTLTLKTTGRGTVKAP